MRAKILSLEWRTRDHIYRRLLKHIRRKEAIGARAVIYKYAARAPNDMESLDLRDETM